MKLFPLGNPFRRDRDVSSRHEMLSYQGWILARAEEASAREASRRSRALLAVVALLAALFVLNRL